MSFSFMACTFLLAMRAIVFMILYIIFVSLFSKRLEVLGLDPVDLCVLDGCGVRAVGLFVLDDRKLAEDLIFG